MNAGNMPNHQFSEFAQQAQNAQQKNIEVYAQSLAQQHRVALNNTASPQAMTQGSPMNQPGLEGHQDMFAGNQSRPGGMPAAPGQNQQGNHALQDYQMQLMLLEQQNKKRLLMARQEQDNIGPHQGNPGFPAAMSPQGSRAGPSPNPADQMKRGTPKLGQQGLPGSPMPEGIMQQQRGSPAPNMNFPDPSLAPPGQLPFYQQMPQNAMMRPPSSHPGPGFNGQQPTPQQIEAMRNSQMNGQMNGGWRGPPQPGMMPQPGMGVPMGNGPPRSQMPPPPAPSNEQPRPEPSPSVSNQAPPTPNQTNKAGPKKKQAKDNKVRWALRFTLRRIDIDFRSPPPRKGQTQVQATPQSLEQERKLLHRLPRLPSRLCTSRSFLRGRMVSSSLRSHLRSSLHNNSPWATTHRLVT